ncbi:COP9 signalosome complex subunit 1 [Sporothrix brasiliensis 5110]|uniref:COP9 signalosome complex subunit 1 n=1 Tax=Sporothrix brasiliensis 5110 TaxID=1398154 RepID=A0A0C2IVC6_9PEZI|nr:COP9 signalosome complex subunit 1 [Sporothrix brasiliensis 5110]KIH93091.1 COP9 signalosome complex subunit 1 [Sporothrix brasiliensis 5110]
MAAPRDGQGSFFDTMRTQGGVVIQETPKFDLESYIQNYKGPTRLDRLLLIGQCSVALHLDALKAAVAEAQKSHDVSRYKAAWGYLHLAAPDDPEFRFNKTWVERTEVANAAETKRLEREMKVYKNNLVKESIRMGNEELGKHYEAIGDLVSANEAYNRMRPDVSTPKHIVDLGKHLVSVAMQRKEWVTVVNQLNKITGLQGTDEEKLMQPYIKSMSGVALLGQGHFEGAAKCFLEVDSGSASIAAVTDGFLSANDIAVYGGLLALATMDRTELQTKVLENSKFRVFLELEPHIRRAIAQFVNGRYAACLSILASYRPDYMLDIFLQRHVGAIYTRIRNKCITNYLIPYSCVTLESMNAAFVEPGKSIETELAAMIESGLVNARIDSINKLVRTVKEKPRVTLHKDALESLSRFETDAIDRLRRINIVAAELEVRGQRKGQNALPELGENWFDSATPVVE